MQVPDLSATDDGSFQGFHTINNAG
jgi:hypothetical protein